MSRFVICITGASGVVYGTRLVEELLAASESIDLVISEPAWQVLEHEMGWKKPLVDIEAHVRERFGLERFSERLGYYNNDDLFAPFCSGSYRTKGVLVVPAAMATVGAIANGVSLHLIERAADVALKEGRRLVILPRETPFSVIHLENLTKLAKAGARVIPAIPGFYSKPETLEDAIDFVVGKVLDMIEVEHKLYKRWE